MRWEGRYMRKGFKKGCAQTPLTDENVNDD